MLYIVFSAMDPMAQKFPKTIQTRGEDTQPARHTWTRIFEMNIQETIPIRVNNYLKQT